MPSIYSRSFEQFPLPFEFFPQHVHAVPGLVLEVRTFELLHFPHYFFLAKDHPHMNFHLHSEKLGIAGLEVVPHPVDVPTLLADDHPLDALGVGDHSKANEVHSVRLSGDGLALEDCFVGNLVVSSVK